MIIGNPKVFAIESSFTEAYDSLSLVGLGYFVIHILGLTYGIRRPDATALGCSITAIEKRIANRGKYVVPEIETWTAENIARYFRQLNYTGEIDNSYQPSAETIECLSRRSIEWAPDGDEAFDDSSYVLQIDIGDQVRLIAFKSIESIEFDSATLREVLLPSDTFYKILTEWREQFWRQWNSLPKLAC